MKAESALVRLGFESKTSFAKVQLLSRSAVTKFFNRQPIQLDTFKRVCEGLRLDWHDIVEKEDQVGSENLNAIQNTEEARLLVSTTDGGLETSQPIIRKIRVTDKANVVKAEIVLEGDFASVDKNLKSVLEVILKSYGGDTIQITDIKIG